MPERAGSAADQMQRLLIGGWAAQVVFVLAELGVPDRLAAGPLPAAAVAGAVGSHPDATRRLLRAAATIGLLSEVDGTGFRLTALGDCLRSDAPGSAREQALAYGTPTTWRLCGELGHAVRTGEPAPPRLLGGSLWDYYAAHPDEGEHFSRAMGEQSARVAAEVAALVEPDRYRRIADIGGAHGDLLTALLHRAPRARGVLFDRPEVVAAARPRLTASPLAGRIELCPGDFFGRVPEADLYLLKWVLHDWDDLAAGRILTACRQAAAPGAHLLVVEMLLPEPGTPSPVPLFDLVMLVLLGSRERTEAEYAGLLSAAGWRLAGVTPTAGQFHVLRAVTG
jgi:hypothetical protein